MGRVKKKTDNKGYAATIPYSTTYTYDDLGRVLTETIPFEKDGSRNIKYSVTKYYHDRNDNVTKEKITNNKSSEVASYSETGYEFDSRNRLLKVITYDNGTPENYT